MRDRAQGQAADRRGRWAEFLCVVRLWLTGWTVLEHRLRPGRGVGAGEIDIVAQRGRTLAFIEVKARPDAETALTAVSPVQQARLTRAAEAYLARRPQLAELELRFDVMIVAGTWWPRRIVDAWRS